MRLNFQDFDPAFPPGWAEIHDRRSFGAYSLVRDAARRIQAGEPFADRDFSLVRIAAYVSAWSLPGSPADEAFVLNQDFELIQWILDSAVKHYEEVHRSPEERKSDPGGADAGVRGG